MSKGRESNDKDLFQSQNVMLFNFLRHMLRERLIREKSKSKTTPPSQKLANKEYTHKTPGFAFLFPCQ